MDQYREVLSFPLRVDHRADSSGWCGLSAVLLLAGCQHADLRQECRPLPRCTFCGKPWPRRQQPPEILPSSARTTRHPQAEKGIRVIRSDRRERVPIRSQSAALRGIITASAEDRAPAGPPQEPEVLPPPERLSAPELVSPYKPAANVLNLTLPSALAQGLAENPDLVTLRGQLPVNEAMVGVAETPIWNPFVQVAIVAARKAV